jgi:hypothetical protein
MKTLKIPELNCMEKLAVNIAEEEAIKAIKNNKVIVELWGGKNTKNTKINISFFYPRLDEKIKEIEIGLEDVRASDGIKIYYDFDSDRS